ncbi:MAG: 50S ribosomal protein L10 [bacterium]|nr:50S ribosomal protein L10 [bacterium]
MPKPHKVAMVKTLNSEVTASGSVVLSDFTGINVGQISELRTRCRAAGVTFRVVKNTLIERAVEGTSLEGLTEHFNGPTAIAFSEDMVAPAKVLNDFRKEFGKLEVKAGYVDGQVIDKSGVIALADLPGREQLLAMVVGTLQAPISGLVRALNGNISGLAQVLDQIAKKKEEAA